MKKIKSILCFMALFATMQSFANGFQKDTVYLYALPYISDSSSVYLVVKGHFSTSCQYQCSEIDYAYDTTKVKLGYYEGIATIVCPVHDTFFVANYATGMVHIKAIVGGNVIANCDSFYTTSQYTLSLLLEPTGIPRFTQYFYNLSPNPATNQLAIQANNLTTGSYQITTTTGQLLLQNTITQPNFTIDVSTLSPGLYFLQLTNGLQRVVKRFVKQ